MSESELYQLVGKKDGYQIIIYPDVSSDDSNWKSFLFFEANGKPLLIKDTYRKDSFLRESYPLLESRWERYNQTVGHVETPMKITREASGENKNNIIASELLAGVAHLLALHGKLNISAEKGERFVSGMVTCDGRKELEYKRLIDAIRELLKWVQMDQEPLSSPRYWKEVCGYKFHLVDSSIPKYSP